MSLTVADQWTDRQGWIYPTVPQGRGDFHWRWRRAVLDTEDGDHCLQWYDDAVCAWVFSTYASLIEIYDKVYGLGHGLA